MSQPSNHANRMKKIFAAMIVPMFLLSVLVVLTTSAAGGVAVATGAPATASSGVAPPVTTPFSLTLNPTVYSYSAGIASTIATATGATFGSGAFVAFCVSTSNTFLSSASIGTITLPGGVTTLSNQAVTFSGGASVVSGAGTYYVAATDSGTPTSPCAGAGYTYTSPVTITVTTAAPTLALSPVAPVTVGSSASITGSGWDAGATVTLYLTQPGSSTVLGTFTTTSGGELPMSASFTVPTLALGTYPIVAQETAGPATAVSVGITADTTFTVKPAITISPVYFSGATGSALAISGTGFTAGSTIAAAPTASSTIEFSSPLTTQTTHGAVTVLADGTFTVTATTATAIPASDSGPQTMSITTSVTTYTFPDVAFVSTPNPGHLGFTFSPTSVSPTGSIAAAAWNFPAGGTITFMVGSVVVGTETASNLGFAELPASAVLPGMPGGPYEATAADISSGLYATSISVTVTPTFTALDPSGAALGGEYLPSGGAITVWSYGLVPATDYEFTDSVFTAGGLTSASIGLAYEAGYANLTVAIGSLDLTSLTGSFLTAPNGTLEFTYQPLYAMLPTPPATGVTASVGGPGGTIDTYTTIGAISISTSAYTGLTAGATGQVVDFSGMIPGGALLYSGTPAVSDLYNVYIGSSILTGTTGTSPACSAKTPTVCSADASGDLAFHYTVPSATGVTSLAIVYNSESTSAALSQVLVIVSTPGTAPSSGTIAVITDPVSGDSVLVGYNLLTGATAYSLNISTNIGVDTGSLASYGITLSAAGTLHYDLTANFYTDEPAGTYSIILFVTGATASASLTTSYTVAPAMLTLSPTSGGVGTAVTASTYGGLLASTYYDAYFGSTYVGTSETDLFGDLTVHFDVPLVAPGVYMVSVTPTGTTTVAASASFEVLGSSTITLFTGGTDQAYAFPGELLAYGWTPVSTPSASYPVTVTVLLNGTAYTTEPAELSGTTLSGSFAMPNSCSGTATTCVGTYWWVTFSWSQQYVAPAGGGSVFSSYTEPSTGAAYLQLVSGNGALLTGISAGQIAEITTAVNTTLKVPLAELHASVESINNATVKILTSFGTMNTTLNSINATVTSLSGSMVSIQTSLEAITVSITDLGAKITAINGAVTSMNETLTMVNGTLTTVSGTLNVVAGNVVTIQTSLGTIGGTVTSISGGVATIQTNLGNLSVAVGKIPTTPTASNVNTAVYLLYAAIALIVVTLALAAVLLVRSGGRGGQGGHPARAYEGPSSSSSTPPSSGGSGGGSSGGA